MTDEGAPGGGFGERLDEERAGWEATRADVARRLRTALAEGRPAATAVVTDVEGSAYRRPGARLVVTPESSLGAITAGCLEGAVAESARAAIAEGELSVETYDLTDDDDDAWGMGLGCNGVIDVLLDPVDASLSPALDAMARKERAVVLTVLSVDERSSSANRTMSDAADSDAAVTPGDRTTLFEDGEIAGEGALEGTGRDSLPNDLLEVVEAELDKDSIESLSSSRTVSVTFDGAAISVFCDVYEPLPTLLVFGTQGDVRPVTRFARETGFCVVVVTGRGGKASHDRFPAADTVRSVRAPDLAEAVEAPEHTYVVLMSHNFLDDRLALSSVLETAVPYVGLMGPRKRFEEMCETLVEEGEALSAADRERISTPVGLDLGGDEPTQIAMSAVAEVLAVVNDRDGGRLSVSERPIHGR